jgi:hypothetical protein
MAKRTAAFRSGECVPAGALPVTLTLTLRAAISSFAERLHVTGLALVLSGTNDGFHLVWRFGLTPEQRDCRRARRDQGLKLCKFDSAKWPVSQLQIRDLGGGSSGWTRTSNPPVNSCLAAIRSQFVPSHLHQQIQALRPHSPSQWSRTR